MEKNQCGILWAKIQSDLFRFEEDVYICNLYIPPSSSKVLNYQDGRTAREQDLLDFDKYLNDVYEVRSRKYYFNYVSK